MAVRKTESIKKQAKCKTSTTTAKKTAKKKVVAKKKTATKAMSKTANTAGSEAVVAAGSVNDSSVAVEPAEEQGRELTAGGDGAARLHRAADRLVEENADELAKLLKKASLKGDLSSMRLLVILSERKKRDEAKQKKESGSDPVQQWEKDKPWEGSQDEYEKKEQARELRELEERERGTRNSE